MKKRSWIIGCLIAAIGITLLAGVLCRQRQLRAEREENLADAVDAFYSIRDRTRAMEIELAFIQDAQGEQTADLYGYVKKAGMEMRHLAWRIEEAELLRAANYLDTAAESADWSSLPDLAQRLNEKIVQMEKALEDSYGQDFIARAEAKRARARDKAHYQEDMARLRTFARELAGEFP